MHTLKTIFMFSGQGSQYYQMGLPLYEHNPVFRREMDELDAFCRQAFGASVLAVIYDPQRTRADVFARTPLSGLAIFMVEYALARTLEHAGVHADLTLGASLGTYAAAAVAGAATPQEAMRSIMRQTRVMEQHCPPGGMLAIIADAALFDAPELHMRAELAALNLPSHFVVAGLEPGLVEIERWLNAKGVTHQRVPVSYAFHSRWIDPAYAAMRLVHEASTLAPLRMPLICCAQSRKLDRLDAESMWKVIRDPIQFSRTIAGLVREGPYRYVDVGPSGTLAGFLRYLLPEHSGAEVHRVLTPFGGELKGLASLTESVRACSPRFA